MTELDAKNQLALSPGLAPPPPKDVKPAPKVVRRIHLTFEDRDDGTWAMYLSGDKQRIGAIPDEKLSKAEIYACQAVRQMQKFLASAGAVLKVRTPGFGS